MSTDLMATIDEKMWTEKEAAHLLSVSIHTMWRWRRGKKVTFFQLPNAQIRYRRQDLEALLRATLRQKKDTENEARPAQAE